MISLKRRGAWSRRRAACCLLLFNLQNYVSPQQNCLNPHFLFFVIEDWKSKSRGEKQTNKQKTRVES